jgi:hypothetical protein
LKRRSRLYGAVLTFNFWWGMDLVLTWRNYPKRYQWMHMFACRPWTFQTTLTVVRQSAP